MNATPPTAAEGLESPIVDFDELRHLAATVAPEFFDGRTVHLLDGSAHKNLPEGRAAAWASWGRIPDYRLLEINGDALPSVVMFPNKVAEMTTNARDIQRWARCVLCHELGHVVSTMDVATPEDIEIFNQKFIREWQAELAEKKVHSPALPWKDEGHDARFTRRCIHLWLRAVAGKFDVPLGTMFAKKYQSHESAYLPTVVGEAARMMHCTFDEIEAVAPPPDFLALWDVDMQRMQELYA